MRPKYLTSPGYTTIHISPWTLNVPKEESIQVPHARPCLKTTWGNLTHDNNDGDDDTFTLIACFNAIIVAC